MTAKEALKKDTNNVLPSYTLLHFIKKAFEQKPTEKK